MDCDSMCSMPLTVVVMARSAMVMIRFSMSSGEMPVYDQMTLTTGILISGKMSVDIFSTASPPRTKINIAITVKV